MLRCSHHRVTVVPVGGLAVLAGLIALGLASSLPPDGDARVWISLGVIGVGVIAHVLTSFVVIRRQGERLVWRAFLVRGEAPADQCALATELETRAGREPTLELHLQTSAGPTPALLTLPTGEAGEAKLRAVAEALGLSSDPSRDQDQDQSQG